MWAGTGELIVRARDTDNIERNTTGVYSNFCPTLAINCLLIKSRLAISDNSQWREFSHFNDLSCPYYVTKNKLLTHKCWKP